MENSKVPFRQRITDILTEFGLNEEDFCIGSGARESGSEIALSKSNVDKEKQVSNIPHLHLCTITHTPQKPHNQAVF